MIDLLSPSDRRTAAVLGILAVISVAFFLMGPLKKRDAYLQSLQATDQSERRLAAMADDRAAKQKDLDRWELAREDLLALSETHIYHKDMPMEMRLDVEKILMDNGIRTPPIEYTYENFPDEGFRKINIGFSITASYRGLRKVIHELETFPKFLVLERIEILDIDERGISIRVRLRLAGYYAITGESEADDEQKG